MSSHSWIQGWRTKAARAEKLDDLQVIGHRGQETKRGRTRNARADAVTGRKPALPQALLHIGHDLFVGHPHRDLFGVVAAFEAGDRPDYGIRLVRPGLRRLPSARPRAGSLASAKRPGRCNRVRRSDRPVSPARRLGPSRDRPPGRASSVANGSDRRRRSARCGLPCGIPFGDGHQPRRLHIPQAQPVECREVLLLDLGQGLPARSRGKPFRSWNRT